MSHETLARFMPPGAQPDSATALAVFWPEPEYHALVARWPHLVTFLGASWDECRQRTERYCVLVEQNGFRTLQLPGDARKFEAFLANIGVTEPSEHDLLAYPDLRTVDSSSLTPWPPARNAPCWCRSGMKYKQCCRPRALGTGSQA